MRSSNSGYAHGTTNSPQTTIEQEEYALKVAENETALKEFADNLPLVDEALIAEMETNGVKFTRENVMFTTRDKTGQIVWLETGNMLAGFEHIKSRNHVAQISKEFNIPEVDVPKLIRNIIRDGTIISDTIKQRHGRDVRECLYEYNEKHLMLVALGTNGFVVSVYPKSR